MTGWLLSVVEPGKPERQVTVVPGMIIGRAPDCGLVLVDPKVSGRHARIVADGEAMVLEDLGSANKTIIDGGATLSSGDRAELQDGQILRIGLTTLRVRAPIPAAEKTELFSDDMRASIAAKIEAAKTPAAPKLPPPAPPKPAAPASPPPAEKAAPSFDQRPTVIPPSAAPPPAAKPAAAAPPPKPAPAAPPSPKADAPAASPAAAAAPPPPKPAAPPSPPAPPKPAAAPPPPKPAPVPPPPASMDVSSTGMHATVRAGAEHSAVADAAFMRQARPRLVIANEALKKTVPIVSTPFTVGRRPSGDGAADCVIAHDAVSGKHARITFANRRFFIEDLDSKNFTYVGREMIAPGARRELRPHTHVRFGSVDVFFIAEVDAEGRATDVDRQKTALSLLEREGRLTKLQRERVLSVAADMKLDLGEALLLEGLASGDAWADALERARLVKVVTDAPQGGGGGGAGGKIAAAVLAVVLIFGALYATVPQVRSFVDRLFG